MKQLFTAIQGSIYNPIFYRELLTKPFVYSWKYYSALALLIAIFLTIISSIPLVADANRVVREFPQKFFTYFPDDFEARLTNGVVTTNVVEPYVFPVPSALRDTATKDGISALVVFDTNTPFSLEQFNAYRTLLWVGSNQFAFRDKENSVTAQHFDAGASLTINESVLRNVEEHISPYYRYIGPAIVVLIFIGMLIVLGFNFIYLIFGALLILILGRVMKKNFSYGKAYQIGLHAVTLPVLIHMLLSLFSTSLLNVPFAATIIMLTVVYVNFRETAPALSHPAPLPPAETHDAHEAKIENK